MLRLMNKIASTFYITSVQYSDNRCEDRRGRDKISPRIEDQRGRHKISTSREDRGGRDKISPRIEDQGGEIRSSLGIKVIMQHTGVHTLYNNTGSISLLQQVSFEMVG